MEKEKTSDTQDLLTLFFLGFLILNTLGFLYAKHSNKINTPLVKLSFAVLQITSKITTKDSVANQVINVIDKDKLAQLPLEKQQAVNHAAGYYSKYLLLIYGLIGIIYINRRPGTHRYTKKLNLQKLIEHNVKLTPCLAPIVYRDPTKAKDHDSFIPAKSPIQFALEKKLLVNQQTGAVLETQNIFDTHHKIDEKKTLFQSETPIILLKDPIKQIASEQLGIQYSNTTPPTYIKGLWVAFDAYHNEPEKGQDILDQLSLRFLNKKKIKDIDLTLTAVENATKTNTPDWSQEPINLALARKFKNIRPDPLSTNQFIWLRMIDRTLWYALNQVGSEVYWSEALAVGLALDHAICDAQQLTNVMYDSVLHEIRRAKINIVRT